MSVDDFRARILPHNLDAEQGLLATLLVDPAIIEDISDMVSGADFFMPAHQRIYDAIMGLNDRGMVPSPVTLKNQFEHDGDLEKVGGAQYLADLFNAAITRFNAPAYAATIRDLALRRQLITDCNAMADMAYRCDFERPALSIVETMESRLYAMTENGAAETGPEPIRAGIHSALDLISRAQKGECSGVLTGIGALDLHLNGMQPGDLVLVAGRPSMGKTVMGLTMGHNAAVNGKKVLFFNLEMTAAQLSLRLLARYSGMPIQAQLRAGELKQGQISDIVRSSAALSDLPLFIDETSGLSAAQIRTRARRHKRRHGLDMIIVDYLGLMTPPEGINSKVYELAEITKALKNMAKEMGVPIVLLHQLSRAVEGRENKRPVLADLRDSGAIEQDADLVLFLYREEYYLKREEPTMKPGETRDKYADRLAAWQEQLEGSKGQAEVVVAKFRQGECGSVRVSFNGIRQCFTDVQST